MEKKNIAPETKAFTSEELKELLNNVYKDMPVLFARGTNGDVVAAYTERIDTEDYPLFIKKAIATLVNLDKILHDSDLYGSFTLLGDLFNIDSTTGAEKKYNQEELSKRMAEIAKKFLINLKERGHKENSKEEESFVYLFNSMENAVETLPQDIDTKQAIISVILYLALEKQKRFYERESRKIYTTDIGKA